MDLGMQDLGMQDQLHQEMEKAGSAQGAGCTLWMGGQPLAVTRPFAVETNR